MANPSDWRARFRELLPALGHRNWILIADSAYPAQVGAVEVLPTGEEHEALVREVVREVSGAPHLRPVVWYDAELDTLPEELAPGRDSAHALITRDLAHLSPSPVLHAELIERLGKAAQSFTVLILKSTGTVPYSSVFLELDCGYWGPEAEAELRRRMDAEEK
ncbi:MAG: hypothetical protein ACK47B_19175 [Armatimonadota bacterium]